MKNWEISINKMGQKNTFKVQPAISNAQHWRDIQIRKQRN